MSQYGLTVDIYLMEVSWSSDEPCINSQAINSFKFIITQIIIKKYNSTIISTQTRATNPRKQNRTYHEYWPAHESEHFLHSIINIYDRLMWIKWRNNWHLPRNHWARWSWKQSPNNTASTNLKMILLKYREIRTFWEQKMI